MFITYFFKKMFRLFGVNLIYEASLLSCRKFLFSTSISYSYTSHNMKLRHERVPCNETPHSCDVINAFWKKNV